jgi:hypothetical protein
MASAKKGAAPSKSAPSKEVAVVKEKNTSAGTALALAAQFEDSAGAGLQHTDQDSFALPFLSILQSNSPQCTRGTAEYIKGAKAGDLFLSGNNTLFPFDEKEEACGVQLIFCNYKRRFLRWQSRDAGGQFRGEVQVDALALMQRSGEVQEQDGRLFASNGDIFKDTRIHFVIVHDMDTGALHPAVVSLSATQVKKSKALLTQLQSYLMDGARGKFNPPTYAHLFDVKSVPESNDKGNWMGWSFERADFCEKEQFEVAKQFYTTTEEGLARVDFTRDTSQQEPSGGGRF